jgi:hypothetical protein
MNDLRQIDGIRLHRLAAEHILAKETLYATVSCSDQVLVFRLGQELGPIKCKSRAGRGF